LGESDEDSAAIRTNHPIPSQCVLFYFEVEIIDKGKNGYVIISLDFFYIITNRINLLIISLILSLKNYWSWILHKKS